MKGAVETETNEQRRHGSENSSSVPAWSKNRKDATYDHPVARVARHKIVDNRHLTTTTASHGKGSVKRTALHDGPQPARDEKKIVGS